MTADKLLEILYPYIPAKAIAQYLGLTTSQIYNRVYALQLKKDPRVLKDQNRRLILTAGKNSRYNKGNVPHNKGKKVSETTYLKCAPTMFKAGHKPSNTREDNAMSIRADTSGRSYYYSKIRDGVWVLSHRLLWEQIYGPIPAKHIVRFKDGNTMNLHISNLECIAMGENAVRNSIHRFPDEVKEVIRLKSKLNKKIKNGKEQNQ